MITPIGYSIANEKNVYQAIFRSMNVYTYRHVTARTGKRTQFEFEFEIVKGRVFRRV